MPFCRRHLRRRALRLPLGLLPLILLVLLAVGQLVRAAYPPRRYVMQISMPLPWARQLARIREARRQGYPPPIFWGIPPNLDQQRPWRSYTLIGSARHDAAMLRAAAEQLRRGQLYPAEQADVCIRFGAGARYAQLVAALDLMPQLGQQKYALDLDRAEPVLFVFVKPFRPWDAYVGW